MSTYREITYLISDELHLISDDALTTNEHIIFLIDKFRAFILKKTYTGANNLIPDSNYQTLCLNLEKVNMIPGVPCSTQVLRSVEEIPELISTISPKVEPEDFFGEEITYVSKRRIKYVGYNKFLKNIIYCTIGDDNRLYLKSENPQYLYLEKVRFTAIFEDASKAAEYSCSGGDAAPCDVLDSEVPIEEALIPMLVDSIVKELIGMIARPADNTNNANDDMADLIRYIRLNMKSPMSKAIEGTE